MLEWTRVRACICWSCSANHFHLAGLSTSNILQENSHANSTARSEGFIEAYATKRCRWHSCPWDHSCWPYLSFSCSTEGTFSHSRTTLHCCVMASLSYLYPCHRLAFICRHMQLLTEPCLPSHQQNKLQWSRPLFWLFWFLYTVSCISQLSQQQYQLAKNGSW